MKLATALAASLFLISCSAVSSSPAQPQTADVTTAIVDAYLAENSAVSDDQDIGLVTRFHFATHTPDFEKSREFYRKLGYTEGRSGFPLSNTHLMARALGMFDICQYELAKGEVISLPGSRNSANIDLLQFKIPFNGEPPYELPNHLGMAYAALLTTHLESDVAYLKTIGTELLSEPYGIPGDQFVFFRDPDGVLYKLMETSPPYGDKEANMHLVAMPYIGINVTDLEASLAFYRKFGYTQVKRLHQTTGSIEEARTYGLDEPFEFKGADIAIGVGDRHVLRLIQWVKPFNPEPPYPPPINHIGINRIALLVPDIARAVAILKSQGVEFLSEIAPCCTGTAEDKRAIVHAIDPDGVFLELVGNITPQPLKPQPQGCPALEIKMPVIDSSTKMLDIEIPNSD